MSANLPRAVGGGAAGGGAAVRRPGRADDDGVWRRPAKPRHHRWFARSGKVRTMPLPRGLAGRRGGSGAASPGYFLDGRSVAEGEVHGVDGGVNTVRRFDDDDAPRKSPIQGLLRFSSPVRRFPAFARRVRGHLLIFTDARSALGLCAWWDMPEFWCPIHRMLGPERLPTRFPQRRKGLGGQVGHSRPALLTPLTNWFRSTTSSWYNRPYRTQIKFPITGHEPPGLRTEVEVHAP